MKAEFHRWLLFALLAAAGFSEAVAQSDAYTNFIRQIQLPSGVQWDVYVNSTGSQQSALEINPGGARFELNAINSVTAQSYLLDTKYVGAYVPIAQIQIRSEDPYSVIPRTRADRPFYVDIITTGLTSGASDPAASKQVTLLRHVQSYGTNGTGVDLDRTQATLLSQASITSNISQTLTYTLTSVPGADRSKVRGEERFSVFTIQDTRTSGNVTYTVPPSQLASQFIQIWPVTDGTISGITQGAKLKFTVPTVNLTIRDAYPSSQIYAQVYKGDASLGTVGKIISGSARIVNNTIPENHNITISGWDSEMDSDGTWTLELLISTPFGIDRLGYVTFDLDRTIGVRSTLTTSE